MASSSGTYKEGVNNNNSKLKGLVSGSNYNGNNNSVHGEWGVPTFQHQQTISMDWTLEEQTLLEEGLCKYATEANIIRYAKIAVQLKNKTVRDVALRCRWMTKKEFSKRRKDDFNARKIKDRKRDLFCSQEDTMAKKLIPANQKVIDSLSNPPRLAIQSGLSHAPRMVSNCNGDSISYNEVGGATRQLLQQNAWVFKQISTNIATHQISENICLLSQARDNIFKILTNLNDMGPTMKKLPPLPRLNEELANSILPGPTVFQIQ